MSMSGSATQLLTALDNASKENEVNLVIELGTDRLIKWVGVYLMLTLAAVAKLSDVIGSNLMCYPIKQQDDVSGDYIKFATTYCWENTLADNNSISLAKTCQTNVTSTQPEQLLDDPNSIKLFLMWLPYFMLVQSFIFSAPLAYWHFRIGSRVVGHLKFMQLLLNEIFEKVKHIKQGTYQHEPYDMNSSMFDARRDYQPLNEKQPQSRYTSDPGEGSGDAAATPADGDAVERNRLLCEKTSKSNEKHFTSWELFLTGNMLDRHFFSMLCYENFASLQHLPYILSAFKLNKFINDDGRDEEPLVQRPLNETMLYLWCDKKNFNNIFLLKIYAGKHLFTALVALIMMAGILTWFFGDVYDDLIVSTTFRCQLPYGDACILCIIRKTRDIVVIFALDVCLTLAVLTASLWKWFDVRSSGRKDTAHFFDRLMETSNVALLAAQYSMEA